MRTRRVLFLLSADFGEFVTARLFSRGQPFQACFALPERLSGYAAGQRESISLYRNEADVTQIVSQFRPDLVLLCSGYLFTVNRLLSLESLQALLGALVGAGIKVATTDPWLRIWALRADARFRIRSVRRGGVDAAATEAVTSLQRRLEQCFSGIAHVFAVPIAPAREDWLSFFNPRFSGQGRGILQAEQAGGDHWVFVLGREDLTLFAAGDEPRFLETLQQRLADVLALPGNRATFIGPPPVCAYLERGQAAGGRLRVMPFCDFDTFEQIIGEASMVVYWNILSASLLYCLYFRTPAVCFWRGHQATVCEGLEEHVIAQVYCGKPPPMIDFASPIEARAAELSRRFAIPAWIESIRGTYERLPEPQAIVERLIMDDARV
ncbi:MAG: hypothetical protein WDZ63_01730 [Burkholderiales bacterium]